MSDDITTAVSPEPEEYNNLTGDFGPQPAIYKTGRAAEPLPQPECSQCHSFGLRLVTDTIQRLKERITAEKAWTSVLVDAEDLSVVLTALERHHQHS